jgi:hypothetical protein
MKHLKEKLLANIRSIEESKTTVLCNSYRITSKLLKGGRELKYARKRGTNRQKRKVLP